MRIGFCTICQKVPYSRDKSNYKEFVAMTNYGTHLLSCCSECYPNIDNIKAEKAFRDDLDYQVQQIVSRIDYNSEQKREAVDRLKSREFKGWVYKL